MSDDASNLIQRYRSRGVLVDANLLLLLLVGTFDRQRIPDFKRTSQFTVEDFDLLVRVLDCFEKVITTPCILTEVSNLSAQIKEPAKTHLFRRLAQTIKALDEQYVRSKEAACHSSFARLGLTDAGIIHLSREKCLVLTADLDLFISLQKERIAAINFNHLRLLS